MTAPANSFLTPSLADADYWRGKRVVVTGGSGFIGSHLVERLLPLAASVVVPTRQAGTPRFLRALAGEVEVLQGDLCEEAFARSVMKGADTALLLAATVGGIQWNMAHPGSVFRDNMRAFLGSLDGARLEGVGRVLITSSACVYPRECLIPTPESEGFRDRPEQTNEGYGWAKRMEEYLGAAYAEEFGMSIAVARPYNAYGPRDDFDPVSCHVIPALIRKACDPEAEELLVWGSGQQSRSFLYVTDFADGLIRICERASDAQPTNVGADQETSIGALSELLVELSETKKRIVFDTTKPEGQPRRHCDTSLLQDRYDFQARVSLADGLRETVRYFREEVEGRS